MSNENEKVAKVEEREYRKFKPTFVALKNKNTIYLLTFFLFVAGILSYQSMDRELFPEIVVPFIMVRTLHPGNSPADMENLITRPIEKELKGLNGVKKMSSSSYQDYSLIAIEFETDVEVKQALQDVKDQVDKAKSELPDDLDQEPIVDDVDFNEFPILNINLSGDYSIYELKKFAEDLQDEFEALRSVREADIIGVDEREIQINVDPFRLEAMDLTFYDVEQALIAENINIGAGELRVDGTRRSITTQADYKTMEEIENTIVSAKDGHIRYLKDVAEVVDGFEEKTSISVLNRQPVVKLSIVKRSGENLLEATDEIYKIIEQKQADGLLPKDIKIVITDDQSTSIKEQISNLENSIIMGMLLVILVLYIFMGIRNAMFSGLAIPMSMFISFWLLSQFGYTINTMILFGLLLALGMLVDNAIVVVENVYRLHEGGMSKMEAVKRGVSEIAIPIISSTATTLAAFVPLLFWPGIVGDFMGYLPITLIIVLASSLFVALVLNPVFAAAFMKVENIRAQGNRKRTLTFLGAMAFIGVLCYLFGNILWGNLLFIPFLITLINIFAVKPFAIWFQEKGIPFMETQYERTLRKALGNNTSVMLLVLSVLLFVMSIVFFGASNPNVIFFPENEPKTIYVTAELPLGTDLEVTDSITHKVEDKIYDTIDKYENIIKSVGITIGAGKGGMFEGDRSPNKSLTTITFVEYIDRDGVSTAQVMKEITDSFVGFVGAKIFVEKEDNGPPVGKPINIEVSGNDFERLIATVQDMVRVINEDRIPGIEELQMDINPNKPEMVLQIDREKARRFGLSTQMIAGTIRTAVFGSNVDKYKEKEDEYEIMVRLDKKYRNSTSQLLNLKLRIEHDGIPYYVPISSVADYKYSSTYEQINRIDNSRVITVYSNVNAGYNANAINARIKELLADYTMPAGYKWKMTGEQEQQNETSDFLMGALLLAIALISMILITQFNSAVKPLIILGTVLLSTIGVFLGLGVFRMDFVILMTGVGIVSLAGIVVNNGIVLIDYIDIIRKQKRAELGLGENGRLSLQDEVECIILGGKTRLRPVLLTAITTVLGLIPLAIGFNFDFYGLLTDLNPHIYFGGDNADFWSPMSWTVIFGLTTSTVLTLIMSPVMFLVAVRARNKFIKESKA
ncbi:Multidrug efflux pump subunit AcrB [Saccharicrinis carchari]|uniref:Multidrug efflux pump subunit AcrB n=1 Tax=Saccharicrinis carchari TaxID=1168039 RepID=A0A521CI43_SACCC|nr:efflux RND transporter permease subunit [Saccharicrinis carchari]SMO59119.1 Multidrug efflux pump subunit AcrB [Saccharicrinis carchari]